MESRRSCLVKLALAAAALAGGSVVGLSPAAQAAQVAWGVVFSYQRLDRRTGAVLTLRSGSRGPYYSQQRAAAEAGRINAMRVATGPYSYYHSAQVVPYWR